MKDQSILLGEINARFGEKFDNLNSNVERMGVKINEKSQEVETSREELEHIKEKHASQLEEENKTYQNTIKELETAINAEKSTDTETQKLNELIAKMSNKVTESQTVIKKYEGTIKRKNTEYEQLLEELKELRDKPRHNKGAL